MATNQKIINAVKNAIGKQVIDVGYSCTKCESNQKFKIYFHEDLMKCTKCNTRMAIDEKSYLSVYEQLKKLFGDNLDIR